MNGNEAKASFKVVVKKKKVVKPVSEPTNNGVSNSNTPNVSGQSNNNTNTSNNTNKGNASNSTNKVPAKNDTSSSGYSTNKPAGN